MDGGKQESGSVAAVAKPEFYTLEGFFTLD